MQVKQLYSLVNTVTTEVLGNTVLVAEDLSNVVDLGTALFNANAYDNYANKLVDRIGRTIFVDRVYAGTAPKVLMDSWEFGSVLQKIQADLPEATENESWNLTNGQSYDPNIFYQPSVSVKFFNSKTTFEIPMSFTYKQLTEAFVSATALNSFVSMIQNCIEKSMTVKIDSLIMRTINNFTGETLYAEYPSAAYSASSGKRCINLLKLYNDEKGTALTAAAALSDAEFLKYASMTMGLYVNRMRTINKIFNIGGKERFTPRDKLHVVLLDQFTKACDSYLQADTFHNELTKLPEYEEVSYWQGPGENYAFADVSKIKLKTSGSHDVEAGGIVGVFFDHDALAVCNMDRRTTSNYNPKAEFYSNWAKWDCSYINDQNEQFIVFFLA